MAPGSYIYLALLFIVAPSVPINRLAAVLIACWLPGELAWRVGFDSVPLDMTCDIVAVGLGCAWAKNDAQRLVTALFLCTATVNLLAGLSYVAPFNAWWLLWTIAIMQMLAIPFGNDWPKALEFLQRVDIRFLNRLERHFGERL